MTKKKLTASDILTTVMLCVLTILFIFPFYWIMTGAFKAQADTIMIPPNGGQRRLLLKILRPW
ncbi:sn-glycerol-3-phosphate transport system permease protein ugpE [Streptococcus pyogenes]|nr:sn-glycerol-3-phosphate transport system permease protein ugpE [Streptococcus pyogenes]